MGAMRTLPSCYANEEEIELARIDYATRLFEMRVRWHSGAVPVNNALAALNVCQPFQLPYQGMADKALQTVWGSLVADIMAAAFPRHACPLHHVQRSGQRIRIGFVSGCFWRHSVWRLPMRGWIENLDRDRFHLFGYHTRGDHDDQTGVAAMLPDRFVAGPRSISEWIAEIERDAPDVLIYPEIGMDAVCIQLAALRLAPVQCTSFGQPITSGLPTVDFFLSSELMEPPGADKHYTETLIRLPGIGTAYSPEGASFGDPLPPGSAWDDLHLPPDAIRFLSCQSVSKYLPQHDDIYPRIAAALQSARFAFVATKLHPTITFQRRLDAAFARHGLNADDFCNFIPGMPCAKFEALVRDADVFLDTLEWSGCNTSLQALAHGVPIVTSPGRFMRGRHSAAILTAAGVTDTIAQDADDYTATAVRLGSDARWRCSLAERMRHGASGMFSDTSAVRALEAFLTDAVAQSQPTPRAA
jgi:predicted O-linked N-acetylglucosamine transferase (SPINDLY family)